MIDIDQVNATHRALGEMPVAGGAGRSLLLRRTYDAAIEDVWDACTDPDRLSRWMGAVEGDLRLGGTFQLKDNAGGDILRCEPPRLLAVTWVMGPGMATEVEVRLTPAGDDRTTVELEHSTPAEILDELLKQYGPGGTIGAGAGWDLAVLGLGLHLSGADVDPATWEDTPEAKEFATRSSHAWGAVVQQTWGGTDEEIAAAVAFSVQHYAPEA
ncbi:activator of HSP90 ATPase [Actinoplanes sp. OR16]|uniref:SRPBCC family protein n=1 Tax=Actinoplanes sp. OR16 TaxID=946334 RepID=UPI000F6BEA4A|nr:SRPBCC family protein [Actinoplanes sp. OR16]BBH70137.1 activator of HSP90 ATPase [Actinoplanes sp. OR16]